MFRRQLLIDDDYRPGDMAHPVRGTDWYAAFHDPDNWIIGIMLGLLIVVCVIWMASPV